MRKGERDSPPSRHIQNRREQVKEPIARVHQGLSSRPNPRPERLQIHPIQDRHPTPLLDRLDLIITIRKERRPLDIPILTTLAGEPFLRIRALGPDDECATSEAHGEGDGDGCYPAVATERARLGPHVAAGDDDFEAVPAGGEVVALGEGREEGVADGC